jgi:hypothetical protein
MGIRERYDRRRESRGPKTLDGWAQDWARAAGLGIVIGWILPLAGRHGGMAFFFQYMERFNGWEGIAELLLLQLGILAILVAGRTKGWRLGSLLLWSALAVLIIRVWAESPTSGWTILFGSKSWCSFLPVAMLVCACPVIAGCNHVARLAPGARKCRTAMALAGVLILLALLVPFDSRGSLLSSLADGATWELAWPSGLLFVLLFLYGVMAVGALAGVGSVHGLLRQMSRVLAVGAPLLFIVQVTVVVGRPLGNGEILIPVMKIALLVYGHLVLIAVGLALLLDPETKAAARRERGGSRLRRRSSGC